MSFYIPNKKQCLFKSTGNGGYISDDFALCEIYPRNFLEKQYRFSVDYTIRNMFVLDFMNSINDFIKTKYQYIVDPPRKNGRKRGKHRI